jgi:hypothetical protein
MVLPGTVHLFPSPLLEFSLNWALARHCLIPSLDHIHFCMNRVPREVLQKAQSLHFPRHQSLILQTQSEVVLYWKQLAGEVVPPVLRDRLALLREIENQVSIEVS